MPAAGAHWRNGWEQISPTPFRGDVLSIAGTSAHDVWWSGTTDPASPSMTAIAHYDGTRTTALMGVGVPTWPIAVVSPTEVWLGPHLRWMSGALERSPSSAPGAAALRFFASNDGWSVGAGVWHWDGSQWTAQNGVGLGPFTAVDGSGPTDVWVAGSDRISRWNGTTWSPTPPLPGGPQIRDVHVRAANDVWAVGSGLFHYDGATWQEVASPIETWKRTLSRGARLYFLGSGAVGQLEAGAVQVGDENAAPCAAIAGNFGVCRDGYLAPTGELFVATGWGRDTPVAGPWRRPAGAATSETTTSLLSLVGPQALSAHATLRATTGGDVLVLDEGKLYRGPTAGPWTEVSLPVLAPGATLEKLSGLSARELWVTFHQQDDRYGALHFDGTRFGAPALFPEGFVPEDAPYSFEGGGGGCTGYVGERPSSEAPQTAIFDGTGWTLGTPDELVLSPTERFRLVRISGERLVAVEHLQQGQWVRQVPSLSGSESTFFPLMATGPADVVLLGNRGSMWRWDGAQWVITQAAQEGTTLALPAIYLGAGRVWVKNREGSTIGVLEKGCMQTDASVHWDTTISGNRERIFALDAQRLWQLRTRTFSF